MQGKEEHDAEIFRESALERLRSPDELDRLMVVTRAHDWLALAGVLSLIAVAIVWSVAGRLPIRVEGQGILIRRGGVLDVTSLVNGQIAGLYPEVGDRIEKGDVIARIAQPELLKELEVRRTNLSELRAQHEKLTAFGTEDVKLRKDQIELERTTLRTAIGTAKERITFLEAKLESQRELLAKGLITATALAETQHQLGQALQDVRDAEARLGSTSVDALEHNKRRSAEIEESRMRIADAERNVSVLEQRLEADTRVISPYRGRVLELRANAGDLIAAGAPLLSVDPIDEDPNAEREDLEALIYVPAAEGKKIHAGMPVHISPSTARREEHGFLIGEVSFVADFPATAEGMQRVLGNEELVRAFLAKSGGAALTVRATLVRDEASPSGYRWSSGQGPKMRITTGTPCGASVKIAERAPASLVLPLLEDALDL